MLDISLPASFDMFVPVMYLRPFMKCMGPCWPRAQRDIIFESVLGYRCSSRDFYGGIFVSVVVSCVMGTASDLYLFYCLKSHWVITQGTWTAVTQGVWHVSLRYRKCVTVSVVGSTSSSYSGGSGFKFWPRYQFF